MVRERKVRDNLDETLFPFKYSLSIKTMVGVGVLIGASLPRRYSAAIGCLLLGKAVVDAIRYKLGLKKDSLELKKGRKMAKLKGDFVVFHIGARPNQQIDSFFKWMDDAMTAMLNELEENPALGYLGGESYVGSASQGPMLIQYWRSVEHLNAYARSESNRHAGPWAKLMKMGRESTAYGFWHETFEVKEGNYECIYVNCPPMLLGNCHDAELIQIEGKNQSAAGRAGRKEFVDYAEHLGQPNY